MLATICTYALPVMVFVMWKKKSSARMFPFFIGLCAYLCIMVPRYMVRLMILTPELKAEHIWTYYLINGIISALFEEFMRLVVFKSVLKDHYSDWSDCIAYAVGHGGCEILLTYKVWENTGLAICLIDAFTVFMGVAASIAMSALIFKFVHYSGENSLIVKAIIIHVILNADRAFYFTKTVGAFTYLFIDLILLIIACVYSYSEVKDSL